MDKNALAKNLRQLRRMRGMTQVEWAKMLEVGHGSISNAERGENWPQRETLYQIAEMFNLEISDLFRNDLFCNGEIVRDPNAALPPELSELIQAIKDHPEKAAAIAPFLKKLLKKNHDFPADISHICDAVLSLSDSQRAGLMAMVGGEGV